MASDLDLLVLWRNLYYMDSVIRTALRRRLDLAGECSLAEHDLMSWLDVGERDRLRMLDLAARLGLTQGGVTRLVDRLVARDWVVREQLPGNRREIYARLTRQGRAALGRARRCYLEALREILAGRLSDDDVALLTALTSSFVTSAGSAGSGGSAPSRRAPGLTGSLAAGLAGRN